MAINDATELERLRALEELAREIYSRRADNYYPLDGEDDDLKHIQFNQKIRRLKCFAWPDTYQEYLAREQAVAE